MTFLCRSGHLRRPALLPHQVVSPALAAAGEVLTMGDQALVQLGLQGFVWIVGVPHRAPCHRCGSDASVRFCPLLSVQPSERPLRGPAATGGAGWWRERAAAGRCCWSVDRLPGRRPEQGPIPRGPSLWGLPLWGLAPALVRDLDPLLAGESGEPALVLSTDSVRAELFGDAAVQGPWHEISAQFLRRPAEAVAAGRPVIIDATHARRPCWNGPWGANGRSRRR